MRKLRLKLLYWYLNKSLGFLDITITDKNVDIHFNPWEHADTVIRVVLSLTMLL